MWKQSPDRLDKNPIDPNYQIIFLVFGFDAENPDECEEHDRFMQEVLDIENSNPWTIYSDRVSDALKYSKSLKLCMKKTSGRSQESPR